MLDKFEVMVFLTDTIVSGVLVVDGKFLGDDHPTRIAGATTYMRDLGSHGFKFVSQIQVKMFNGEYRINWVFERQLN